MNGRSEYVITQEHDGCWLGNPDNPRVVYVECSYHLVCAKIEGLVSAIQSEYGPKPPAVQITEEP